MLSALRPEDDYSAPMPMDHVEQLRVAWSDTDAGGRIHFTAALRYAELAENGLRRKLGLLSDWADYPRRHIEAEYRAVLGFEDEVEVRIRPERLGRTSITWSWEIDRAGEVCVTGQHTVVHVDSDGRPSPLPDEVREGLR
jgi:acyl-CoA thioester hydrolase